MADKNKFNVRFLPFETEISVSAGMTLLDAIHLTHLPLKTSCGGAGTCLECRVKIVEGEIGKKAATGLPEKIASQGFVLACRTLVAGDMTVQLPHFEELSIQSVTESDYFQQNKERLSGVYEIAPPVTKISLTLDPPSFENKTSDLKGLLLQLKKETGFSDWGCPLPVLRKLAGTVRQDPGRVDCILSSVNRPGRIIDVSPTSEKRSSLGIACDIGTSTVALHLVDLSDGKILSTASSYNQQIKCGQDIISRIHYSQKPGRLHELRALIVQTINQLIRKAVAGANVLSSHVDYASFSGNTTMIHLFLGCNPHHIRLDPYVPTFNRVPFLRAENLDLEINREADVFIAPSVGSYVGGDITAGLLGTPMLRDDQALSLFIDAGTNGELVVGNSDWLMTCACSAGPAFEGSGIKCGMPASEGAIESLTMDSRGEPEFSTIMDSPPKGLCGSGLVDLLAELFSHGTIDRSGKFIERKAQERLIDSDEGPAFLIVKKEDSFWGKDIVITENDIASLIRTKGAVFSACALLLKNVGLDFNAIDYVFIAGGFGRYLNVENAVRIGLLPDLDREKFQYMGNSSLLGALLVLLSEKNRKMVENLADRMTYVELNTEPGYMDEYTGALFLPHTKIELFPSVKNFFRAKE
jgi:uncharacterized 2Fe-2S/4Fe-4S cluster protein (DUF4445 family)